MTSPADDERVAALEPLDVDGVRTVVAGTALWLVAGVVLLGNVSALRDAGRLDWLWTCFAGVVLGLVGLVYCRRRRSSLQRVGRARPSGGTSRFGAAG